VKPGCNYGYECLVEIGKLRYLQKRQIKEIQHIMNTRYGIPISVTQVRRLCYQFLLYLGRYHYSHVGRINESISKNGGYVLHIDSTCEGCKPHLLTCIDSLSGYVLYSQKISGENEIELAIIFKRVKSLFWIPLAIVHDMGAGINKACAIVFPGVLQVICHFHLLRDIGKDLFEAEYRQLQKKLSKKKIYAKIRYQIKSLEKAIGSSQEAEELLQRIKKQEILSSVELLRGILYGDLLSLKSHEYSGKGYGFPFDRPKVYYYHSVIEIYKQLELFDTKYFSWDDKQKSRFYEIINVLQKVVADKPLRKMVKKLEDKIVIFDELRQIMRIALPADKHGLNDSGNIKNPDELNQMEVKLNNYVDKLKDLVDKYATESKQLKGVIVQLEKYWDKIFTRPITVNNGIMEKTIIPQRTNNISEQFYRKLKQLFRRLHGRRHVNKDLVFLPEEITLIENLKNKDYIHDILGSMDTLADKFADLDCNSLELSFEKEKSDFLVSQKMVNLLKTFKPIKSVDSYFQKVA